MKEKVLKSVDRWLLRSLVWLVVLCSIAALFTKWRYGKPSGTPVHYLLGLILLAGFLPMIVPKLDEYVLSRLSKLDVGGLKLELVSTATYYRPKTGITMDGLHPPSGRLAGEHLYLYERLSFWIYQRLDQNLDLGKLEGEEANYCRTTIIWVSRAANVMRHFSKSLDLALLLSSFRDREMTGDEQFLLGTAYLWAAEELALESGEYQYYHKAIPFLESAAKQNPRDTSFLFNLGWAFLCVEEYDRSIEYLNKCIEFEDAAKPVAPYARQNIAVALEKQGRYQEAINELKKIPAGKWWPAIKEDTDLLGSKNAQFQAWFADLCRSKAEDLGNEAS